MSADPGVRLMGKIHARMVFRRRIEVLGAASGCDAVTGNATSRRGLWRRRARHTTRCCRARLGRAGRGDPSARGLCHSLPGLRWHSSAVSRMRSFDCCMFVDVLHHTQTPLATLRDACRVSGKFLLIKDHFAENSLDHWTLRLMDWVGNRSHGVALPYAYLSRSQWQELQSQSDLGLERADYNVPLYPRPFSAVFGRNLHFISLLKKNS